MNRKLLSVIVAVYNAQNFLRRCVWSLLKQDYNNIEILLIDDGSTDMSPDICDELSKFDSRVKVFHKKNGGCYSAWNLGLTNAKGDYVTFVDNDDIVHFQIYSKLIRLIDENKADIATCGRIRFQDDSFKFENNTTYPIHIMTGNEATFHLFAHTKYIKPAVWDKVYKKEIFDGIRFPNTFFEDAAVTYKALMKSKIVVTTEEPLYAYYVHCGSMITSPWNSKKLKSFFEVTKWAENDMVECGHKNLAYASLVWRLNFAIEAWCRSIDSKELSSLDKRSILRYISKTTRYKNLYFIPTTFKRKIVYLLFPYAPNLLVKILKIKF